MASRDEIYKFMQAWNLHITLGIAVAVTSIYALFGVGWTAEANLLIGKLVNTILTSFTFSGSLVAFLSIVFAPDDRWGEMKDQRTNIGIGCLVSILASLVLLIQAF